MEQFFNDHKLKIFLLGVLPVLAILIILTCPLPKRLNYSMSGYEITSGGNVIDNVEFIVDGWYLNYLFRDDKFDADITIKQSDGEITEYYIDRDIFTGQDPIMYLSLAHYYDKINRHTSVTLIYRSDFDRFMITNLANETLDSKSFFMASTNEQISATDLFEWGRLLHTIIED